MIFLFCEKIMQLPVITEYDPKNTVPIGFERLVRTANAIWFIDEEGEKTPLRIEFAMFREPSFYIGEFKEEIYRWKIPGKVYIEHLHDVSIELEETVYYPEGKECDPSLFEPGNYIAILVEKSEGKSRLELMTIYKRDDSSAHSMGHCGGSFLFDLKRNWKIMSTKRIK